MLIAFLVFAHIFRSGERSFRSFKQPTDRSASFLNKRLCGPLSNQFSVATCVLVIHLFTLALHCVCHPFLHHSCHCRRAFTHPQHLTFPSVRAFIKTPSPLTLFHLPSPQLPDPTGKPGISSTATTPIVTSRKAICTSTLLSWVSSPMTSLLPSLMWF